jgi:SpoIIAA-like
MMKLLTNLPDYVVGVSASGQVDAKDYETVLTPAIESVLRTHDRVRVLYQLTPEFTGFTSGAMWDDSKLGLANWKAWERIAIVTDVHWVAHATRMFAFLMPGLVKVFSNEEQPDAEQWIAA